MTTKNWTNRKKLLTKTEMRHLTDAKCFTKTAFQWTIDIHARRRMVQSKADIEPCFICKRIAKKLGMEGKAK